MKISKVMVDTEKASGGVWVDYVEDVRLKIGKIGNPAYQTCLAKLLRSSGASRMRARGPEAIVACTKQAVAKHVLLGWEGFETDDGSPIEFSPEKALEFLEDERLQDMYSFILESSNDLEAYLQEEIEDAGKN